MKHAKFDIVEIILILVIILIAAFTITFVIVHVYNENVSEEKVDAKNNDYYSEKIDADKLNENMIGTWVSEEGVDYDIITFGYMSDAGFTRNPDGQLCILVDYGKGEGGGNLAADYSLEGSNLVYTTFDSSYSAGGGIEERWVIDPENLSDGEAEINGVPYIRINEDPSKNREESLKIIESRLKPIIVDEWEGFDGMVYFKLNNDGTMRYEDSSMGADGTWEYQGGMEICLHYVDVYSHEETSDYFYYDVDNDCMMKDYQYEFERK